jgi:hypothetical protein
VVKLNGKVIEKSWQIGRDINKSVGLLRENGDLSFRRIEIRNKK